jgi:hypothetical protein
MLSEFLEDQEQAAVESFRSSQISAWKSWMAGLLQRNRHCVGRVFNQGTHVGMQ